MNLDAFRYFLEVAKQKNFSNAAQKLYISQPALSQQIVSLEKQLGIKLLRRTTRKVTLTEEGEYLYKKLASSFEMIESTIQYIKENKIVPKAKMNIATVPTAASLYIPNLFKKMILEFPEVEFYLHETTSSQAIELVRNDKYHLALIRTPIQKNEMLKEGMKMVEFSRQPLQLVVSVEHPLASKQSIHLEEVRDENFIHYDKEQASSLHHLVERACTMADFTPKRICTVSELFTAINLVSNNVGVAFIPKEMVDILQTGKIRALPISDIELSSSISAIWKDDDYLPLLTSRILDILQSDFTI
ncbi:hypothetical protein BLX87_10195 [Bacillus sp. VT-16-64]|nr:hypothetical protein BLX87_10195 [Bacillus sp. VT-16-64]